MENPSYIGESRSGDRSYIGNRGLETAPTLGNRGLETAPTLGIAVWRPLLHWGIGVEDPTYIGESRQEPLLVFLRMKTYG